jgi:hypothetical protein
MYSRKTILGPVVTKFVTNCTVCSHVDVKELLKKCLSYERVSDFSEKGFSVTDMFSVRFVMQ